MPTLPKTSQPIFSSYDINGAHMPDTTTDPLDDEFYYDEIQTDQEGNDDTPPDSNIENANNARRRLEAYWEKKALKEYLRDLDDDWD